MNATSFSKQLILFILLFELSFCKSGSKHTELDSDYQKPAIITENNEVRVTILNKQDFCSEIISNGKAVATQQAQVQFKISEMVTSVPVKNGDIVKKGQVLATLDQFTMNNKLKLATEQYDQSKIELENLLLGQGYSLKDTSLIPPGIFHIFKIKSGYQKALTELDVANYNLTACTTISPINGIVANLNIKPFNTSQINTICCLIIDNSVFNIEFSILENELTFVQKGQAVKVRPFSTEEYYLTGTVSEINPLIDSNGQIAIRATVINLNNTLMEGMNLIISVKNCIINQISIPKTAVVLRNSKQVVFTYENGIAKWNYIKTIMENSEYLCVSEGLKEGDSVIISGNLNLAHDAKVEIEKSVKE
jgi:RND family efflux transporter MFP subunit